MVDVGVLAGLQRINGSGKRLRDVCRPGDSEFAHLLRELEQCYRSGTGMENCQTEGVYVQGRRVPITENEFQSLCGLHDDGTFKAQSGLWHKMERKLVEIQNGGPVLFDEMSEAKMLHNRDKTSFSL